MLKWKVMGKLKMYLQRKRNKKRLRTWHVKYEVFSEAEMSRYIMSYLVQVFRITTEVHNNFFMVY